MTLSQELARLRKGLQAVQQARASGCLILGADGLHYNTSRTGALLVATLPATPCLVLAGPDPRVALGLAIEPAAPFLWPGERYGPAEESEYAE